MTITEPTQQITLSPYCNLPFFTIEPNINFDFTSLSFWQLTEMKKFAAQTPLMLFSNYGFNGEIQKGKGTLTVSKLKIWNKAELEQFEDIMDQSWQNFCSYL